MGRGGFAPRLLVVALGLCLGAGATPTAAQDDDARLRAWAAEKCRSFEAAWMELGTEGLGREFVEGLDAFIGSGCREGRDVCPRSPAEFAQADALTIAAINMGAAGSFLPFACR